MIKFQRLGVIFNKEYSQFCIALVLAMFFYSCKISGQKTAPDFLYRIQTQIEFDQLAAEPLTEKYGQVASVKVIWDLSDSKLYFTNSQKYHVHYDFCRAKLGFWKSLYLFNQANYSDGANRRFVLANINFYPANDIWALEFSSADLISIDLAGKMVQKVRENTFFGTKLKLMLNTQRLLKAFESENSISKSNTILPEDIYAGLLYQPLNCQEGYGYLRRKHVVDLEDLPPGPTDIVVLDGPALDIPVVAGLFSPEFQTPLSHLVVLCKNRVTPYVAQKDIWQHPQILAFEDKLVHLTVTIDSFHIEAASLKEAEKFWKKQRPGRATKLRLDSKSVGLVDLSDPRMAKIETVGGKARNFGILMDLANRSEGGFKVPECAFGIPFSYYLHHFEASGAKAICDSILNNPQIVADQIRLKGHLERVQNAIERFPVDPKLLAIIEAKVNKESSTNRMRFRSSTNAEDIEGFNGAGLYDSKTGIVGDSAKSIEKAIRKVWASLWNLRAFQEREYFRIDHHFVAMGILVHRSFPEEFANGVAITKNLYRDRDAGFVINVQIGEVSVVSPPAGVDCDQLLCYSNSEIDFFKDRNIIEYITRSSLLDGRSVLTDEQVIHLTKQLEKIKRFYYTEVSHHFDDLGYGAYALDVEFKFDGPEKTLYIKQVRPYKD